MRLVLSGQKQVSEAKKRQERPLVKGDSILVIDFGWGIGGFAAYELEEKLDIDSKLTTTEHSHKGDLRLL